MEEMRRGYKPGTYSTYTSRKEKRNKRHGKDDDIYVPEFKSNFKEERNKERADLKEGIDDLMTRINNLEVIMESEKKKGE